MFPVSDAVLKLSGKKRLFSPIEKSVLLFLTIKRATARIMSTGYDSLQLYYTLLSVSMLCYVWKVLLSRPSSWPRPTDRCWQNVNSTNRLRISISGAMQCILVGRRLICRHLLYIIKSNQINVIYIAQNHNHFATMGFTICTVNHILCPSTLNSSDGKLKIFMEKKKKKKSHTTSSPHWWPGGRRTR